MSVRRATLYYTLPLFSKIPSHKPVQMIRLCVLCGQERRSGGWISIKVKGVIIQGGGERGLKLGAKSDFSKRE